MAFQTFNKKTFFEMKYVKYKTLKHNKKVLSYANAEVQVSLFNILED